MAVKVAEAKMFETSLPKAALVLDGGGAPGALYEIGVLTALDDSFGNSFSAMVFDFYVGTSAGAVNNGGAVRAVRADALATNSQAVLH
ncbi:MAG TPA: patatin-like phospholipase family protein [Methylomirabilota bacterium]|jgi:predicted acylesterase/phospholipase RssA|nr:patatin-like phospholipase family protein [Methylomirabilota bacterium]